MVNVDSRETVRSDFPWDAQKIAVSPTGERIAFSSSSTIYILELKGVSGNNERA